MDQAARERIRHEIEDEAGQGTGDAMVAADGKGQAADGGFTPVMVRLTVAEVEAVDTLITAGVANSRAGAIRWALTRIRERPAYERLRRCAREIERLKAEF
jgi:hypothetical protein